MLINFVDATNGANHYTKPPPSAIKPTGMGRVYQGLGVANHP